MNEQDNNVLTEEQKVQIARDNALIKKALEKRREAVEGLMNESEMSPHFPGGATEMVKRGRCQAYQKVLSILSE